MALTPNDILRISEPVEQMYMDCTSQLLINLSKHFKSNTALSTREYETQKLSELGELTNESIEIIAANTGRAPEEIKKAVTEGMGLEIQETEKVCQAAAAKGTIQSATTSWQASERVKAVVDNLVEQATEDSNIVNTVMLNSTRERYVQAVQYATQEEAKILATYGAMDVATLESKLQLTQGVLNQATLSTAIGAEARTQAVRRAVEMVVSQGITGYIDAGGHKWSPEAYINMDIRTTVHNAAVQGQKARSADYDVQTFQISSHAGARPLCAPYQGKIYSWDGSTGVVTDLYGVQYPYEGIGNTSYGQPAGIFGINCGHRPVTFVDGYSRPRFEPTQDEEENKKQYELSQKQRYLERQIRDEKTKALCYDAAGDKEAFDKAALRIKEKNTQYKEFCKANNLTQRPSNTQVYGYNKNISNKANTSAKVYAKAQAEQSLKVNQRDNYIKNIKPTLPKSNVPLPNTTLQQTLNVDVKTKGKYDLHSVIPKDAEITEVRIIAGYGTSSVFRNGKKFADAYGGDDYQWQKVGGLIKTDNFVYDVHWHQNSASRASYVYELIGVKEKK